MVLLNTYYSYRGKRTIVEAIINVNYLNMKLKIITW